MNCRFILFTVTVFLFTSLSGQTFTNSTGGAIPDDGTQLCFPLSVSGVGFINTSFGLSEVCLNITHTFTGDLEISLRSPNGTVVSLSNKRGGGGDNYTNTCFTGNATQTIASASPPFTGTFLPEGVLGSVNNGQNADGVWTLCIRDASSPDAGMLHNFSLNFNNNPAPPGPPAPVANVQDCLGAIALCTDVYNESTLYINSGNHTNEINRNTSCLRSGERNSVWYTFTTQTAGNVSFVITPFVASDDYDWAVYNLTNAKCSDLFGTPSLEVSCNWAAGGGPTGPNGGTGPRFNPVIPVSAGQTYAVLVSRFSNISNGYSIDFGASTAVIYDTSRPTVEAAIPANTCGTNRIQVFFTENVLCSTVQTNAFTITGPGGPYTVTGWASSNCNSPTAYGNNITITTSPSMISGGNYQVCFNPTAGSFTDLCTNTANSSCSNFTITPGTVPSFSPIAPICQGSVAPVLPATSFNGITGNWTPSVVSNSASGTYIFTSTANCNMQATLAVTVNPKPSLGPDKTLTVCSGQTTDLTTQFNTTNLTTNWTKGGSPVSNPSSVSEGVYQLIATNSDNCSDTALVSILLKSSGPPTNTSATVCENDLPYTWNGNSYMTTGTYNDTLVNAEGCDSVMILNLVVKNNTSSSEIVNLCSNQLPYTWNGNNYNAGGIYNDTIINVAGCDSIMTLNLNVSATLSGTTNANICSNHLPYVWNGNSYNAAGTYTDTVLTAAGCDSVIILNLTVNDVMTSSTDVTICSNQLPYIWNGNNYSASGTYTDTILNAAGCDSIMNLNLTVANTVYSTTNATVCFNQLPYIWNGNTYNVAGIYYDTIVTAAGCDSVLILNLTIINSSTSVTSVSVCSNELPYIWNGNNYNNGGTYTDTITNVAGCDSIMTLNLLVKAFSSATTIQSICANQLPFLWNGNSYSAAGIYTDTITNAAGCDSIITLNLSVKPTTNSLTNTVICQEQLPFLWNGNSYNSAGTFTDTLINAAGCDSIVTLNLSVKPTTRSTTNKVICVGQLPFIWNGNSYNTAGTYTDTLINAAGCDSILMLQLSVLPNTSGTTIINICEDQLPFMWNNKAYNTTGIYVDTIRNAAGCDSIISLNLSVKAASASVQNVNVCQKQLPYIWNGKAYNAAGTYVDTITNAAGCDSVMTLHLALKPNSTSTTIAGICESRLPFVWNGKNYNATGLYTDTILNAAGCDSIMTLQLSVNADATSTSSINLCASQLPFVWNGNSYSVAGTYNFTTVSAAGCDPVAVLNLVIKDKPSQPVVSGDTSVCSGETLKLFASTIPGATYRWTGPNGFGSSFQDLIINNASLNHSGTYSVSAFVDGCASDTTVAIVTVTPTPVINAGPDKEIYEGDTAILTPVVPAMGLNYKWTPALYFISPDTVKNPAVLGVKTISYSLTATNNHCISKADVVLVKVLPRQKPIYIPNAISPNGDGINDTWFIKDLVAFPGATVEVYNRYGTMVFNANADFKPWDGSFNGSPLPVGTYYYIIRPTKDSKPLTGSITILK